MKQTQSEMEATHLEEFQRLEGIFRENLTFLLSKYATEETLADELEDFIVDVGVQTKSLLESLWQEACSAKEETLIQKRRVVKSKMALNNVQKAMEKFYQISK